MQHRRSKRRLSRLIASHVARGIQGRPTSVVELEPRRLFAGQPVAFNAPVFMPTQSSAALVLLGDMNNDGKPDTVTIGTTYAAEAAKVSILLGNGNGSFQTPQQVLTFGVPISSGAWSPQAAIADMNRDGKQDLVIVRRDDAAVTVMYGNGNGTFGSIVRTPMPSTAAFGPTTVAVGDIDNDQWPDVMAGRFDDTRLVVLRGGTTLGAASQVINLPNGAPILLQTADFDRNGKADVAFNSDSGITVIRNLDQTAPTLSIFSDLWPGQRPGGITVVNLLGPDNGPGLVACASTVFGNSRVVSIPRPIASTTATTYDFSGKITAPLITGDFNRDGFGDVIIGEPTTNSYNIATGSSSGVLDIDPTSRPANQSMIDGEAADLNGDGYLDFVGSGGSVAAYVQIPESLTVTTAVDEDDGTASPGVGTGTSLREAVGYASRLGGGVVTFAPALGNANAVINLTRGIMPTGVNGPTLTIRNDTGRITIDGSGNGSRPFVSFYGNLAVQNLTFRNFSYGNSGGVFFIGAFSPSLTIDNCTFTGNSASGQGSVVYAEGLAPVTIRNSTFTGNGGNNLIAGYGWSNGQYITLQNNTIYGNTANGVASLVGNVYLQNNIIANNGTADVVYAGGGFVGSNNIIRTGGGPAGSLNVDPLLGALADNGGRTSTMLPAPNSPAINAAAAIGLTADQRGTARPQGALPDIGAVERAATAAQITAASFESSTRQAVNFTFNAEASVSFSRSNITLTNLTTNQVSTAGTLSWNAAGTQASLVLTNQLADGNYRLQSGATTLDFTVMAGDFNRDRTANFDDLLILAANYNQSGRTNAQGDANYDGVVNFDDLLLLAGNYNRSIAGVPSGGLLVAPPPVSGGSTSGGVNDEGKDGDASVLS
jgi:methionine-rich copper-binding protein CopC